MLEKPNIADELIMSRLQEEYGIHIEGLNFHPSGDFNNAAYSCIADDETKYFLKLRKGFEEINVTVPLFLRSQGIENIIVPYQTKSKHYWADFGDYEIILYPFIKVKMALRSSCQTITNVILVWRLKRSILRKYHQASKGTFRKKPSQRNGGSV